MRSTSDGLLGAPRARRQRRARAQARSSLRVARALAALVATSAAVVGCGRGEAGVGGPPPIESAAPEPVVQQTSAAVTPPSGRACAAGIPVFDGGHAVADVCEAGAGDEGLTVVDLSDEWAPGVLAEDPLAGERGRQPYRSTYLALAAADRDLELYGVFPAPSVLAARLADDHRGACHASVDAAALLALAPRLEAGGLGPDPDRVWTLRALEARLERRRALRKLPSIEALEADRQLGPAVRQLQALRLEIGAVRAAQERLRCEGLLRDDEVTGAFRPRTGEALSRWQRRAAIPGVGRLDAETAIALAQPGTEADLRALLRVLRERVADAAGLLEDGSAAASRGAVAGRSLDPRDVTALDARGPMERAAPDLVSEAADAAARALGWTDPVAARASLAELHALGARRVALRLPAAPAYHRDPMALRVEIDRGDVWYDYPYTRSGARRSQPARRRPTLVVHAADASGEIALVRWPTTIGGWQPEEDPSCARGLRYKESETGEFVWRDLVASPAWRPPPTTPDRELVTLGPRGWTPRSQVMEPGYLNAYGLVLFVHHAPVRRGGHDALEDHGIRTHGSVSYLSIVRGQSHGCHRLFNHLALRVGAFLLRHRAHERRGPIPGGFERRVAWGGASFELTLPWLGYRWELTPPVQVTVLPGRVLGERAQPIRGLMPLPPR